MDNRDYNGWEDSEVEKSFLKIKFRNEEIPSIKLKSCGIVKSESNHISLNYLLKCHGVFDHKFQQIKSN